MIKYIIVFMQGKPYALHNRCSMNESCVTTYFSLKVLFKLAHNPIKENRESLELEHIAIVSTKARRVCLLETSK